ncbi:MAG: hypothetical protein PHN44_03690 [Candidatus Marinimicrobia bacterium]|nr:hypothetical protein [Candidatus Neomarinimicrobiota bacterium]MDD5539319.1 hypothetical protein [Candidatus Neomarinimicrobiota bacterium]
MQKRDYIGWVKYTMETLRDELAEKGRPLTVGTVSGHLRRGKFGHVEYLQGADEFLLQSNAVDNFLHPPLPPRKKRPRKKNGGRKIIVPKYSEEEAAELAQKRLDEEILNNPELLGELSPDDDERTERQEYYTRQILNEYVAKELDEDEFQEQAQAMTELPQDLFGYIATRYAAKAQREYFINRYWQYIKANQKLDMLNPMHDTILRNVIDDEIKINHLRWLMSVDPVNAGYNEMLNHCINRWTKMMAGLGILGRAGQNLPEKTVPKEEGKAADPEKEKDELFQSPIAGDGEIG